MRRVIVLLTMIMLFATMAAQAQNRALPPAEVTEHRITTARVNIHACPQLDCDTLTTYVGGTPLFILGTETGDAVEGDDQWYRIRDTLTGREGYISHLLTADARFEDWQLRPVVPTTVSDAMREVYARGMTRGNDPAAFSKTGDCQNVVPYFLSPFADDGNYDLGAFGALQETIDHFAGSFDRVSASVDNGFNVASVLSPLWANKRVCEGGETPLLCEERLHNPSIAIINMETWWQQRPASEYEAYLSRIVEFWLDQDVVPILGTKADNLEGDNGINEAIVRVADQYQVPLWNFWLAVQQIPGHGLTEDGFHLTFARDFYDDPVRLEHGWPVRNLTALEALDAVWRALNES
ncbi:MAG: SH3 domain-containing protein [Anaerolineae bacterium]|nr:SH3 domain-containing protein [Anaerolineae bacterium]